MKLITIQSLTYDLLFVTMIGKYFSFHLKIIFFPLEVFNLNSKFGTNIFSFRCTKTNVFVSTMVSTHSTRKFFRVVNYTTIFWQWSTNLCFSTCYKFTFFYFLNGVCFRLLDHINSLQIIKVKITTFFMKNYKLL